MSDSFNEEQEFKVVDTLSKRYLYLLRHVEAKRNTENANSDEHLKWMLKELIYNNRANLFKKNRWLGFIQAHLILKGYTTLERERDIVRDTIQAHQKTGDNK